MSKKDDVSTDVLYQCLDALFTRPKETILKPKQIEGGRFYQFQVSDQFVSKKYQKYGSAFLEHCNKPVSNGLVIKIDDCKSIPDLRFADDLKHDELFSIYIPLHQKIATQLLEIFMNCPTIDQFISTIVYCRERVNPYLFNWVLTVTVLNHSHTTDYCLPVVPEIFPEKFFDGKIYQQAEQALRLIPIEDRTPVEIPQNFTATLFDHEQRCAYFREDIGLSFYYLIYSYAYPFCGTPDVVKKERRGEIFYHVHRQILARYNFERFCNGLHRTNRLSNFEKPIEEPYFPKLNTTVANHNYPPRYPDSHLDDLARARESLVFDKSALSRWRDRILEACDQGVALCGDKNTVNLNDDSGINTLGNMIQSSLESPNLEYYGDLANTGQLVVGYCHDPDGRNLEGFGVISDPATCLRDPVFYRWYSLIVDMCDHHKKYLPHYTKDELGFPGIKISHVETFILTKQGSPVKNELLTYWEKNDINISKGLDFSPTEPIFARITHLQHQKFSYKIVVENSGSQCEASVRIFLAPKKDENKLPFTFNDQRNFFIEMDYFNTTLQSGSNTIVRRSWDSSILDWMKFTVSNNFRQKQSEKPNNYTGLGWPLNLLVPKGKSGGFECELFVMVGKDLIKPHGSERSLGFPFDRPAPSRVHSLSDFLCENMFVQPVRLYFLNQTLDKTEGTAQPFVN
ncbi:phenoloxidase 1-like [Phlebotomus argentipes]|uniref:phenoloxidase 1-like n=1 Tax=Phlebotomus argentipes TaxID=94469 RepID=UPI002892AD55|nr:phenoloxidase 1-like [Phlebotomus argentipes]